MNPFEWVSLGSSAVGVTRLGMGLAPIGGLYAEVGEQTANDAIDAAWHAGIRFFDTAPLYGAGLSERRSGPALKIRDRDSFTLATKVGRRLKAGQANHAGIWAEQNGQVTAVDFTADGVRTSWRESLDRLGLDRVDVLHLHDPDEHYAEAVASALPELVGMRREGVIGAVSAGMNQSAMLTEFARTGQFDCFLLAGRYTLLDQSGGQDLLPECARRGISVIAGGVYNSGILAGGSTYDYRRATPRTFAKVAAMAEICQRYGVPLRAAALQFPLRHPAVVSVLVGMRDAAEVADAIAMSEVDIPDALWHDLVKNGHLEADA